MSDTDTSSTVAATPAAATTDTPTEAPALSLQITDIQNAIKVIDHAAEQGAFRGWQIIEQVLAVRVRLANFVSVALPKVEAAAEDVIEKIEGKASDPASTDADHASDAADDHETSSTPAST